MNWERAIGPGWDDPLIGQTVEHIGGGAQPVLVLAIVVALVGVLVWICQQPERRP